MEKTHTWLEAREVATNGISNNQRDDFKRSKKFSWGNSIGQKDRGRFSPYKGQNHKLLSNLVKSPREILATEKVAKTFEQPSRLPRAKWSKDKTRYYHFHIDYGHETNQCRELKHQIEEAVKSGKLAHLVKGVKEKKEKTTGTRSEERKKEEKKPILDKVYVLMISGKSRSSDPVIIKVYISGRKVNRAYIDGGSSCDVIYEHCFLKLKPSIRSLRVDSNTPLVYFSGEQSWPLGEIPLQVTIRECPIAVTKTLTFVIVKSDSSHNLLLGRTAKQQMGIVVSTVHGAIKFHKPRGIGTILSEYNLQKPKEEEDDLTYKYQGNEKNVPSCIDTEERMVIND
ncbi:reverse transcriptase domain-containing protein, partial [Tanacetum coccineum]